MAALTEAALKIFIEEGVEHRIQAAVHIAQSDAEVHQDQGKQAAQVETQGLSQDHDLHRCPADNEGRDHHQYHPGDTPQVAILLFRARQDANAAETLDHQAVADADDGHRDEKREQEDTGAKDRFPVTSWFRENHNTFNT